MSLRAEGVAISWNELQICTRYQEIAASGFALLAMTQQREAGASAFVRQSSGLVGRVMPLPYRGIFQKAVPKTGTACVYPSG